MCGAIAGGPSLDGIDISQSAIVQGVVLDGVTPISKGYVRLLDMEGDFTAEVPTSATGQFRFFAAPGSWRVRVIAPGVSLERTVSVELGHLVDVVMEVTSV